MAVNSQQIRESPGCTSRNERNGRNGRKMDEMNEMNIFKIFTYFRNNLILKFRVLTERFQIVLNIVIPII